MDLAALVVRLEAQTAEYDRNLARATQTLQSFQRQTNSSLSKVDKAFSNIGRSVAGFVGAYLGARGISAVINATAEAEEAQAALENAVEATGRVAGFTAPQLAKMAGELQNLTKFDDEAIEGMQALLLSFTRIRGPEFERAQRAILDLASRMGGDLRSAALTVGKALDNPIDGLTALQKAGVRLSDSQKQTIKDMIEVGNVAGAQNLILGELEKKFKGAAEAAANTFGGALAQVKNAFNDLLEQGALPDATNALKEITNVLRDPGVKQGIDAIFSTLLTNLAKYVELVTKGAAGWKVILSGRGGNDVVDIDNQIRDLESRRARVAGGAVRGMPEEARKKALADLDAQIAALTKRQELAIDGIVDADGAVKEFTPNVHYLAAEVHDLGKELGGAAVEFGSMEESAKTALNSIVSSFDHLEDIRFDQFGSELEKALDATADDISESVGKVLDSAKKEFSVFADEAARSTQGIIADTLKNGFKDGAKGVLQSVGEMIRDITAQIVAADLAKRLFGDVGKTGDFSGGWVGTAISAIGGLFGGTRDSGGRGQPGAAYAIGTGAQPEMFIPDRPGTFVPVNKWGGGKNVTIHQNFTLQQPANRQTQQQIGAQAARSVNGALRRNG